MARNSWKLDEKNNAHESSVSLDISKALNNLGWTPSWIYKKSRKEY